MVVAFAIYSCILSLTNPPYPTGNWQREQEMSTQITKLTDESQLVAGILYCLFTTDDDAGAGEAIHRDGALVYWTGEYFMDETGDERYDDWDFAVAQTSRPNAEYVVCA